MCQIIIDFGTLDIFGFTFPLRIYGYGLMMVLGFLVAIALAWWRARRAGENPETITQIGILSLIGGVLGARFAYIFQHWDTQFANAPLSSLLDITSGGLIYYGGLILGALTVIIYLLVKRLPARRYLDIMAASLMIGLAFGRMGCLVNGCCFGSACSQDWALGQKFPMFSKPLIKLDGRENPFSMGQSSPSPVYQHQLEQRAAELYKRGTPDSPNLTQPHSTRLEGYVNPDSRLVNQFATGIATVKVDDGEVKVPILLLHPPGNLHGCLESDQLTTMFGSEKQGKKLFDDLAGADAKIGLDEWRKGLKESNGFLRGSEHWNEAMSFDANSDKHLDFEEARLFLRSRKALLIRMFCKSLRPKADELDKINEYLKADEIELALNTRARAVKPAQVFGIINALLLAGLLMLFHRFRKREGQVFAMLLVLYPITRFVLEAIRDDNPHNILQGVLTHNQYTSLAMMIGGIVFFFILHKLPPLTGLTWAERVESKSPKNDK